MLLALLLCCVKVSLKLRADAALTPIYALAKDIANIPILRDVLIIKRNFIVVDYEIWYTNIILYPIRR